MCFDHLINYFWIISFLYNISHMISIDVYFYKHVISDMGFCLSKINEHLKPTNLSNYLNKMKQKINQFKYSTINSKMIK